MVNQADVQAWQQIGRAIRVAREAQGLSQEILSERVGCSRSTLHQLENFKGNVDIGALKIAAAAREAGLRFGIYRDSPDLLERKLERQRAANRNSGVREKHFRLAAELAVGKHDAFKRIEEARRMVQLWRQNNSCSPEYIARWSDILSGQPLDVARKILSIEDGWLNALFQNTPFAFDELAMAA